VQARISLGWLVCALTMCCASTPLLADPTAQRLVGRWSQILNPTGLRDEIAIDLNADQTLRVKVRRHYVTGTEEFIGAGSWRVENGDFVAALSFPGPRDAVSHLDGRHRITAVTQWEWVMEFRNREQLRAWRYPE
jgi:hypothetical protein